eukprot:TRINITY_DN70458_c0_g1_i1.p1 TRINITY_DN70458_c0_g1~~TRINITY_DN70458_c0_g1_i1.p1  ORF type:complete len:423 (+),score=122.65 TRINITY_DN70458_c0_g1_i1:76-1269(+)
MRAAASAPAGLRRAAAAPMRTGVARASSALGRYAACGLQLRGAHATPPRTRVGANGVQVSQHHPGLSDTFGRFHDYLRISITERCSLRCQYCMPADGVPLTPDESLLTTGEIIRLAKVFCTMGVKKVRLTGGEPLVRRDFATLAQGLGALRADGLRELCMTTNALALSRNLPLLQEVRMDRVNISLDTLCDMKFQVITRRRGLTKVLQAIDDSLAAGIQPKINCVVMRGVNDDEVEDFVLRFVKDRPVQVRFIEYMPFNSNGWKEHMVVPWMELWDRIERRFGKLQQVKVKRGDTSKNYTLDGHQGSVGFITTMTSAFCGTCNRLRLTADGQLKVCLHDSKESSLLQLLRDGASDEELMVAIGDIVVGKKRALGGHENAAALASDSKHNRPMITIGG